jgi:hypothetical protein
VTGVENGHPCYFPLSAMETMKGRLGRLRYPAAPLAKRASRTQGRIQFGTGLVEEVEEAAAHVNGGRA